MRSPLFCLADAIPGDCVAITGLAFESLRFLFPTSGFDPGSELRCIGLTTLSIRFETRSSGKITLDRFYACFMTARRTEYWSRPR